MTQHDKWGSLTKVEKVVESFEDNGAFKTTKVEISVEDHDGDHAFQKASELEDAVRSVLEDY